jgi:hypothetical protein
MNLRTLIALSLAMSLLAGCTSLKKLTGQKDDTILPGQREEVLPPDAQTARDPLITGEKSKDCDLNDPDCIPPIDQEATPPQ